MTRKPLALLDRQLLGPALLETFKKLDPRTQVRNPVMFIVYAGTLVTALLLAQALAGHGEAPTSFILSITIWLAFTVLFANFAEALAEGRSRAQASTLRDMRQLVMANKLTGSEPRIARNRTGAERGSAQGGSGAGAGGRSHPGGR